MRQENGETMQMVCSEARKVVSCGVLREEGSGAIHAVGNGVIRVTTVGWCR